MMENSPNVCVCGDGEGGEEEMGEWTQNFIFPGYSTEDARHSQSFQFAPGAMSLRTLLKTRKFLALWILSSNWHRSALLRFIPSAFDRGVATTLHAPYPVP